MLAVVHVLLIVAYGIAPIVALAVAWRPGKCRNANSSLGKTSVTLLYATILAVGMSVVYARNVGGTVDAMQVVRAAYFASGMLCLLKWFDAGTRWFSTWACRCRFAAAPRWRIESASAVRLLVLVGIGLPYIMATVMTYRIKVHPDMADVPAFVPPGSIANVRFRSTDGVDLAGWWIPAPQPRGRRPANWAARTVVLCHGLGSNKANQLDLVRDLVPAGFNVLAFDFRAHGDSGGQLCSFGDLERFDVLAAVHWLRTNRPEQSQTIDGMGISMGAAALIAAAADDSDDGRSIAAIVAYSTYNDLPSLARTLGERFYFPGAGWIADHVMLPMASAQTGANLSDFSPSRLLSQRVARPVMIVHGQQDNLIDFSLGEALYQSAEQPKAKVWIEQAGHNDIVDNDKAARAVLWFFEHARTII